MLLQKLSNTDYYLLRFLYYYFKIFGLSTMKFQIKLENSNKVQRKFFARSRIGIFYNTILICVVITLTCWCLQGQYVYYIGKYGKLCLDTIIDIFHTLLAGISTTVILLLYGIQQEKIIRIVGKIKHLTELSIKFDNETCIKSNNLKYEILGTLILITLTWFFILVTTEHSTYSGVIIYYCNTYICNWIITNTIVQYIMTLKLMKNILKIINANFECSLKGPLQARKMYRLNCDNEFKVKLRLNKFLHLRELYLSLCEASDEVSKFFAQMMLLSVAFIFVTLINFTHYLTKPAVVRKAFISSFQIVHCSSRILHYFVLIITLTKAVSAVVLESRKTGKILNKWLGYLDNQEVDAKLYHFSNFILHNNMQFSVFGFFSLDESLLMSIIGSLTTYLVIFLQFQANAKE